ncbi:hypothetical protein PR048_008778 [Dryococelus australis]|uniref:Uncharacterized protein n=1 Tax=Dryococelus australis TaxID=614101 RepID=A0ABQ9HY44_9NEOP|nr:hypothetical protein PR048_008778 [Dryococelus australis]
MNTSQLVFQLRAVRAERDVASHLCINQWINDAVSVGDSVAERLDCSPPTKMDRVQVPAGFKSLPKFLNSNTNSISDGGERQAETDRRRHRVFERAKILGDEKLYKRLSRTDSAPALLYSYVRLIQADAPLNARAREAGFPCAKIRGASQPGIEAGSHTLEAGSLTTSPPRPRNAATASMLASHQGEPESIPGQANTGFSHVVIVPDDAAGLRVFPAISRFPRPFILALRLATFDSRLKDEIRARNKPRIRTSMHKNPSLACCVVLQHTCRVRILPTFDDCVRGMNPRFVNIKPPALLQTTFIYYHQPRLVLSIFMQYRLYVYVTQLLASDWLAGFYTSLPSLSLKARPAEPHSFQIFCCLGRRFGWLLTSGSSEPMRVIEVNIKRRGKTRRPTASSGTIPTCENPVTLPGIEPAPTRTKRRPTANEIQDTSSYARPILSSEQRFWIRNDFYSSSCRATRLTKCTTLQIKLHCKISLQRRMATVSALTWFIWSLDTYFFCGQVLGWNIENASVSLPHEITLAIKVVGGSLGNETLHLNTDVRQFYFLEMSEERGYGLRSFPRLTVVTLAEVTKAKRSDAGDLGSKRGEDVAVAERKGEWEREYSEITRRLTETSSTFPTCESLGDLSRNRTRFALNEEVKERGKEGAGRVCPRLISGLLGYPKSQLLHPLTIRTYNYVVREKTRTTSLSSEAVLEMPVSSSQEMALEAPSPSLEAMLEVPGSSLQEMVLEGAVLLEPKLEMPTAS